jgi:DNA-binding CsgD family transcriptional regulator/sugar lactone lactonase YvrE
MGTSSVDTAQARLSRREMEIARLVAQGLTNREIATRLFISERTVDGHLEHVREKLAVNTRAQIAAWVVREDVKAVGSPLAEPISRPARAKLVAHPRLWVAAALVLAVLAAAVGVLRLTAPPEPVIRTIAGITSASSYPGGGYSGDHGYATSAALSWPSDLAVGPDGTTYVADFGNLVVRRISNTIITTVVGGGSHPPHDGDVATTQVSIGYASNLAIDSHGDMYVLTDVAGDLEVWMVAPDSIMTLVLSLGHSSRRYMQPQWNPPVGGLAVAADGTLYIADRAENQVWKLGPGAKTKTLYAGTGEAGASGDLGAAKSAQLDWPTGLALGRNGDLYIADSQNNRIRRVDGLRGTITTVVGAASLSIPFGVAFRSDDTLFIADSGHNRVLEMLRSGDILTVAGTGSEGFSGDAGAASEAKLSGPNAVALDGKGNLLIADSGNHRVRLVSGL